MVSRYERGLTNSEHLYILFNGLDRSLTACLSGLETGSNPFEVKLVASLFKLSHWR